jgi:hypothetical protein
VPSDQSFTLPPRVFQIGGDQGKKIRPLSILVKSRSFHAASITRTPKTAIPILTPTGRAGVRGTFVVHLYGKQCWTRSALICPSPGLT